MKQITRLVAACLVLVGCAGPRAWTSPLEAKGRAFAIQTCAQCHYVEGEGAGPSTPAISFREMGRLYSDAALDSQMEQIASRGHQGIAPSAISDGERRALIAYMTQLRP